MIDIFMAIMRQAQQESENQLRQSQNAANLAPEGSQSGNILLDVVGGNMSKAPGTSLVGETPANSMSSATPAPVTPPAEASGVPSMTAQLREAATRRLGNTVPGAFMSDMQNPNVSGTQAMLNMVDRNNASGANNPPPMPAAPGYTPPMSTAPNQGIEAILARSANRPTNLFNFGY